MAIPKFELVTDEPVSSAFSAALDAVNAGRSVFPAAKDKRPDFELLRNASGAPEWRCFQSRPPTPAEMACWRDAYGFALVTGSISGIVVLDVDRKNGKDGFATIAKHNLHCPVTVTANTPTGGTHHYYRLPPGVNLKNGQPFGSEAGLDFKGEAGYVLATGTPGYSWAPGLSPRDTELADCPEWLIEKFAQNKPQRKKNQSVKSQSPSPSRPSTNTRVASNTREGRNTCYLLPDLPEGAAALGKVAGRKLSAWYRDEQFVVQAMRRLGADVSAVGEPFHCILPADSPDQNPSANLHRNDDGVIVYKSWRGAGHSLTIPEVAASVAYRKVKSLVELGRDGRVRRAKPEMAVWGIRLLVECGILAPAKVAHRPLPDDLPADLADTIRDHYRGFIFLLQCKWLHQRGEATPYTWEFARRWAGTRGRNEKLGQAMSWLLKNGYIAQVATYPCPAGQAGIFMPGRFHERRFTQPNGGDHEDRTKDADAAGAQARPATRAAGGDSARGARCRDPGQPEGTLAARILRPAGPDGGGDSQADQDGRRGSGHPVDTPRPGRMGQPAGVPEGPGPGGGRGASAHQPGRHRTAAGRDPTQDPCPD